MQKTSFHGNRRLDAGFSLFAALCVICALSLAGAGVCSVMTARYKLVRKSAAQFYDALAAQNEAVRGAVVSGAAETGASDAFD